MKRIVTAALVLILFVTVVFAERTAEMPINYKARVERVVKET